MLLICATATSLGNYLVLATTLVVVAFCYVFIYRAALRHAFRMLKAMRWFFLSIVVIYFWFTPGQMLITNTYSWLPNSVIPTFEGLELGMHRVLILALIVFMVNLLLHTTPPPRLLVAIYWWLRPLEYISLDTKKVSLRISLVFTLLQEARGLIDETRQSLAARTKGMGKPQLLGVAIGEVVSQAEHRANQKQGECIALPVITNPPPIQWLLPIGLIAAVSLLQSVVPNF